MRVDTSNLDYAGIRNSTERELKNLLTQLADIVRTCPPDYVAKQIAEYARGERSSNISDAMICVLGPIRSALEEKFKYYEVLNALEIENQI